MSTDSDSAMAAELADARQRCARYEEALREAENLLAHAVMRNHSDPGRVAAEMAERGLEIVRAALRPAPCGYCDGTGKLARAGLWEVPCPHCAAALAGETGARESALDDEQYTLLRDALDTHLSQFFHDDDVAEVAIYIEGVERLGCALAAVKLGDEGYEGPVEWGRYQTKERTG